MKMVSCPVCRNECSRLANACPKCGHPFKQDEPFPRLADSNKKPKNYGRYIGIAVGLFFALAGIGIVIFFTFSDQLMNLASKSPQEVFFNQQSNSEKPSPINNKPIETGKLNLEAGILYQHDGFQPVARVNIYLLDVDLTRVLLESGIKPPKEYAGKPVGQIALLGFAAKYPDQFPQVIPTAMKSVHNHSKYETTSDFQGKAKFLDVMPGTYYLFGLTTTRRAYAIWNLKVEVKAGENSVTLDTNNAASAL